MNAQVRDPVVPPTRIRPDVGDDLERVVLRCLAKAPEERFSDAEEFGNALGSCTSAAEWDSRKAASWWAELERKAKAAGSS